MTSATVTNQAVGRGGRDARWAAAVLGVVVLVAVTAWACRASGEGGAGTTGGAAAGVKTDAGTNGAATPPSGAAVKPTPLDTVETTLSASGFTPNQVGHAAGRFELKVNNQSGEGVVTLRLADEVGNKLSEAKLTSKVKEWAMPVDLQAGSYTLSEVGHSSWTCAVSITAP